MKRAAIVFVLAAVLAPAAGAQRASRPADDWIATLEAPERIAGLKIPEVVAAMKLRPGDVVVDLGAGSGLFVVPLSSAAGAKGKVLAVEIDRNFFPHIQRKAQAAGVTNVQTISGEATDPKLPELVDVALLHDVLHHIENPAAYIKSLAKYLKPTARIVIVDYLAKQGPHRDDPSLQVGKEEAAKLLAAIGFKPVDDVALFPDKYFVIYGRTAAAIPRLADGKPDMQGYWTNQTFTPLERPAQWKDKTTLTADEAAAYAKTRLNDLADQPRGAEVQRDADIHYDDAIWMLEGYSKGAMLRTSIITDPPDGRIPPLSAEGRKRAEERAAARKGMGQFDSAQTRGLSERCIYWAHEGPPILPTGYNSNLQIHQAPQTFVLIPEMMPAARIVPLDGRPKLGAGVRGYRGDSRGRWEGDTMVIETTNYYEKTAWRGSGANLKVTERLTMTSPTTIRYQFTVDDPSTWSKPWSGEYEMTRIDGPLYEYACHEGNYGLPSILKGARLAEEAAQKPGSR